MSLEYINNKMVFVDVHKLLIQSTVNLGHYDSIITDSGKDHAVS